MPGEALWEIFRKHLQQIEKEGGDLTILVKEVRQIRDRLLSVLSDAARTQEEMEEWFAGIRRNSPPGRPRNPGASPEIESQIALEKLEEWTQRVQNLEKRQTEMDSHIEELRAGYESAQKTLSLLEDFFERIYDRIVKENTKKP